MASSFSILHASVFPLQYRAPCISTRRKGKSMGNGGGNWSLKTSYKGLEMFYDDGYLDGRGLSDYFDAVTDVVQHDDAGPPRWFCPVDAGPPMKNAPLLLFLPGLEGNGMGLFMHHKALGRVFEVRCMHIPLQNRMPFEGLARFVEEVLKHEFAYSQSRPIYLLGNGFGGCLALTVAARNPNVDLSLILSNPVTCFGKLHMEPLLSFLLKLSDHLDLSMAYFLSFSTDLKVKMNYETLDKLSKNLRLPQASKLLGQTPRDTLLWKLQLLKSAALYTNSRLQVIKAAVLVLASYLDKLQPNKDEAKRLQQTLMDCKVWYFEDHGHNLLLDNDIHLMTTIKSANFFRHFKRCDRVSDYLPPSRTEFEAVTKGTRDFYRAFSPVMFSTMDDGKIVPGLSGIPNDGPVLVVGNHVLMGLDVLPLVVEFLKEKAVVLRGLGHPFIFPERSENSSTGYDFFDFVNILGAVPVSGRAFYKLLAERSFILLYPGGHHEAFHRKGEENKLFWPTQPEFVRMCGQFEATIVPFGVVGDVGELLLDRNDILRMPFIKNVAENYKRLRVANHGQHDIAPLIFPKIPGRFYYLFGKPLKVGRKMDAVQDRQNAKAIYLHVKSEVERIISYLHNKSKEDMYQSIFSRFLHEAIHGENCKVPTFEP